MQSFLRSPPTQMTHREGELDDPKHRVILRHFTFRIFQFQFFNLFYIAVYLGSARLVIDAYCDEGSSDGCLEEWSIPKSVITSLVFVQRSVFP